MASEHKPSNTVEWPYTGSLKLTNKNISWILMPFTCDGINDLTNTHWGPTLLLVTWVYSYWVYTKVSLLWTWKVFLKFGMPIFPLRIPNSYRKHRVSKEDSKFFLLVTPSPRLNNRLVGGGVPLPFLVLRLVRTVLFPLIFLMLFIQRHVSITACLVPICSLYGAAVTTVEGVGSIKTKLHPVQVGAHANTLTS